MNIGAAFEAMTETAKLVQPRHRPLDDPAKASQPAPVLGLSFGQQRLAPTFAELLAVWLGVEGAIALHAVKALTRPPALARNRTHIVDEREQLGVTGTGFVTRNRLIGNGLAKLKIL